MSSQQWFDTTSDTLQTLMFCLRCHGDANCSLCPSNSSEKGESATLTFPPLTLTYPLNLFSYLLTSCFASFLFLISSLTFLLFSGSSQETSSSSNPPRGKILGFLSFTFLTNCAPPCLLLSCFTEAIGQ